MKRTIMTGRNGILLYSSVPGTPYAESNSDAAIYYHHVDSNFFEDGLTLA